MSPLKEEKITIATTLITSGKENDYFIENKGRIENHKKIMAHLEAIAKHLDTIPTKQAI